MDKLDREVIERTVRERIDKRLMRRGQPDYDVLKAGVEALDWHLDYFNWLLGQRPWFAGEKNDGGGYRRRRRNFLSRLYRRYFMGKNFQT